MARRRRFSAKGRSSDARRIVRVFVTLLSAAVLVVCGVVWFARAESCPLPAPVAPPSEGADDGS